MTFNSLFHPLLFKKFKLPVFKIVRIDIKKNMTRGMSF